MFSRDSCFLAENQEYFCSSAMNSRLGKVITQSPKLSSPARTSRAGWLWVRRRRLRIGRRGFGRHVALAESGQRIVAHGKLIDRGGDHNGRFLGVFLHDSLVGVQVGVPGMAEVFDG